VSGKKGKDDGESFADLVDDVVPLQERDRTHAPATRRPAPERRGGGPARSGKTRFIRDTGDGSGRAEDAARRLVSELRLGEYAPEREIDLHGLRRDAAGRALTRGLAAASTARERCVLVIHGVGRRSPDEPVLKRAVPDWIENTPQAAQIVAYAPAPRDLGGEGATLILLRRARTRSE
jgi:DNA-nicking Smr family endonuclease